MASDVRHNGCEPVVMASGTQTTMQLLVVGAHRVALPQTETIKQDDGPWTLRKLGMPNVYMI